MKSFWDILGLVRCRKFGFLLLYHLKIGSIRLKKNVNKNILLFFISGNSRIDYH